MPYFFYGFNQSNKVIENMQISTSDLTGKFTGEIKWNGKKALILVSM